MTTVKFDLKDGGCAHVNVDSNKLNVIAYDNDGRECPIFEYNSSIASRYRALRQIRNDIGELFIMLKYLENSDNNKIVEIVRQSVNVAFIVSYGKLFTASNAGRKLVGKTNADLKGATPEQICLHNEIMNLRHEFIAHAGNNDFERSPTLCVLKPRKGNKALLDTFFPNQKLHSQSDSMIGDYLGLISVLAENIERKIDKTKCKLAEEIARYSIDDMYDKSVIKYSI